MIRKFLAKLWLSLSGLCLSLLFVEIVLRLFLPISNVTVITKEVYKGDGLLGHRLRSNIEVIQHTDEYSIILKSNSDGLRNNDDYNRGRHPDVVRILVLGDSFTFGMGVNIEQTYAKLLETRLNAEVGLKAKRYEVINGGMFAWGLAQELLLLRSVGGKYEPNVVIVGFIDDNIFRNAPYYDRVRGEGAVNMATGAEEKIVEKPARKRLIVLKNYAMAYTRSYPFVASVVSQIPWLNSLLYRVGLREGSNQYVSAEEYKAQSIAWAKDIFTKLRETSDGLKSKFVVVIIPVDYNLRRSNEKANEINRIVIDYLQRSRIPVLDLTDAFASGGEQLYFPHDRHPNKSGHELIARRLYVYLKNEGIVR